MGTTATRKNRQLSRKFKHPVKFEIYGDVLIEKIVKANGKGGRIYLPPEWVGKKVKIIRYSEQSHSERLNNDDTCTVSLA